MSVINNLGIFPGILLDLRAVRGPLPEREVLELFVPDLHGLWDQLSRLLQELNHVLRVKDLFVVVKLVLKAEESIQHALEVVPSIKYLMLRQFKRYYAVVQLL